MDVKQPRNIGRSTSIGGWESRDMKSRFVVYPLSGSTYPTYNQSLRNKPLYYHCLNVANNVATFLKIGFKRRVAQMNANLTLDIKHTDVLRCICLETGSATGKTTDYVAGDFFCGAFIF